MIRPSVAALVRVCWVVLGLGPISADMGDALAAAEAWAYGEEPAGEEYQALAIALGKDERCEAVYWTMAAAYDPEARESAWYVEQALATLAYVDGWDVVRVTSLATSFGVIAAPAVPEAA